MDTQKLIEVLAREVLKEIAKRENEKLSENKKNNNVEQKTDTAKKTNNTSEVSTSEETGTINDIKNEIKLQIKEQAQKEGIQLTDEEIEKLAKNDLTPILKESKGKYFMSAFLAGMFG